VVETQHSFKKILRPPHLPYKTYPKSYVTAFLYVANVYYTTWTHDSEKFFSYRGRENLKFLTDQEFLIIEFQKV
jgi:hypothetical protein